jgi:hypothetical protein
MQHRDEANFAVVAVAMGLLSMVITGQGRSNVTAKV